MLHPWNDIFLCAVHLSASQVFDDALESTGGGDGGDGGSSGSGDGEPTLPGGTCSLDDVTHIHVLVCLFRLYGVCFATNLGPHSTRFGVCKTYLYELVFMLDSSSSSFFLSCRRGLSLPGSMSTPQSGIRKSSTLMMLTGMRSIGSSNSMTNFVKR